MKILGVTKRIGESPADNQARADLLIEEVYGAWNLQLAGFIREVYLALDWKAAVAVVEAESVEHAREELKALPMVRDGLVDFDLTQLGPYASLSLLFRSEFVPAK